MSQFLDRNNTLSRAVRNAAQKNALGHAIILSGTGDRVDAAQFIAAAHVCQSSDKPCLQCAACRKVLAGIHPDVRIVQDTERKELSVDMVRELRQDVYIRPNEAARKVYIFADCGQLNERDQNVLLKIVEEGPAYAAFIFCTVSSATLLQTIRSRCMELKMREEALDQEEDPQVVAFCQALSKRNSVVTTEFLVNLENRKYKREQLQTFLQNAAFAAAQALLLHGGKPAAEDAVAQSAGLLSRTFSRRELQKLYELLRRSSDECRYNVGVGHVLGAIIAQCEELLAK